MSDNGQDFAIFLWCIGTETDPSGCAAAGALGLLQYAGGARACACCSGDV